MQVMMSSIFIEKQHKQEITVIGRFQDVFESIMVFNHTFKITSCPDNMKWHIWKQKYF